MVSVQVRGKEQLTNLAAVLEAHGAGKSIRRALGRTIRDESAHITREQRSNLAQHLPHRGGLAAAVSGGGTFSIRTRFSGSSTGVTIVDSWKGHNMKAIDAGLIRHPVFGRWIAGQAPQPVKPDLLGAPVREHKLPLQLAIIRSLNVLAEKIARET